MADRLNSYDLSLFEARYDNTVPAAEPKREPRKAPKIVKLPKSEPETTPRRRRHPVKAIAATLCFSVFVFLAGAMVYSQEQLAVLTEEINQATELLEESQSIEIQLNMQAAQKMNSAEVEDYAVNVLGMTKIESGQVIYVSVEEDEKGTVVQSTEDGSFVDRLWTKLQELLE